MSESQNPDAGFSNRHNRILNEVPELDEGDKVKIQMLTDGASSKDERTLTVAEKVGGDGVSTFRGRERDAYVLTGYGAEYRLGVVTRVGEDRVELSWKSRPCGRWVKSIEVVNA